MVRCCRDGALIRVPFYSGSPTGTMKIPRFRHHSSGWRKASQVAVLADLRTAIDSIAASRQTFEL